MNDNLKRNEIDPLGIIAWVISIIALLVAIS